MGQVTDIELFVKIKSGNQDAFEFIFLRYYEDLCLYAKSMTGSKEASEEIVQDVFVKIWESRETLEISSSVRSYLYRFVHNQCVNELEHWKVKNRFVKNSIDKLSYNSLLPTPFSSEYPIANLIVKELEEKIDESIRALPSQCREVFLLIREEELSYQQVADKLNISVNTVKTQMQRAVAKLREMLREYLPLVLLLMVF